MTEAEELTKQVDLVYKNLLDKFNPAARTLITAGKAYLKALHGAMSASKLYLEALTKVARHSQQGLWGGSSDIGMCLMQMVDVYKEVQSQQMNILKAFYVDLLVPLETNLDKDTKVLQSEQKKFLSSHKHQLESYTKAASQVKKHKKKTRANKGAMDKEIKQYQALEEEKLKLDTFVESSLQNAVTQERRRYGFILERQCSLAKHYLAYHSKGSNLLQHTLDNWNDVAKTREVLPERILTMLPSARPKEEGIYSTPMCLEDDAMSVTSQMRKARSVDASCLDLSNVADEIPSRPLTRARSEFNLDHRFTPEHIVMRRSMAIPEDMGRRAMARALYSYSPSGDNQLSFSDMDLIALIGEKNKGWQYGENLRTQRCGWFPVAYTEIIHEEDDSALGSMSTQHPKSRNSIDDPQSINPTAGGIDGLGAGDGTQLPIAHTHRYPSKHRSASAHAVQFRAPSPTAASNASTSTSSAALSVSQPSITSSASSKSSHVASSHETLRTSTTISSSVNTVLYNHAFMEPLPPRVAAPSLKKSPSQPQSHSRPGSNSFTSNTLTPGSSMTLSRSFTTAAVSSHLSTRFQKRGSGNSSSFHSSDDSGFSNESGSLRPPVNPDADYSDDDLNGVASHSMNSLSSRWLSSASTVPYISEPVSLPCLQNSESFSSCEPLSLQHIPPLQESTVTLPTPSRRHKTLKCKHHRDFSLPSLSIDHFVTMARRKSNKATPNSPCAQKIAAQRERGKEQGKRKRTLHRSSSLLCLGMDRCTGILDDLQSADYEDVWSKDWRHSSLIDLHINIPDPPPFEAPSPPIPAPNQSSDYSVRPPMPIPQDEQQSPRSSTHTITSDTSPQNSSSGNSTLTGSDEENEGEIYMVISDHRQELRKTITRARSRKQVSRSLTWASPAHRSISSPPKLPPSVVTKSSKSTFSEKSNWSRSQSEQSSQQSSHKYKSSQSSYSTHQSDTTVTPSPPLPPKKRSSRPQYPLPDDLPCQDQPQPRYQCSSSWKYVGDVNILNYSDFMNRRLKCPEGVSRLDQVSFTTGNLCGPWYDLWEDDPSVADV